ncbi:hypothetical protein HBH56_221060 [Parastagonospora nodorum]|uniref:Uncharacterized protein n=1 Tax=Phaeosphaeria nodorum (strain SN15 / ATCC MYA-4574 / FGSC 10173) TaxID=321614 RepID=A0A7U2F1Z0_PHANO|nr:hypothetical protein HBH56_221060 [Parastagonospora nodorum]QRC97142.1 hypothetical protein JI435_434620 [Parastagonospora nodorum SN15]KAH3924140.1 hypothetical protein HBH54_200680 [Parastagonospora nodorum]KAH4134212.1 hypothetical protein HBH45_167260 [Parastagonospora nodorum]KAH4148332.1 hypothetical protein HBH44_209930 [Parastagonospora nodorum]
MPISVSRLIQCYMVSLTARFSMGNGIRDQDSCNSLLTFTTYFVQNVEINNICINSK